MKKILAVVLTIIITLGLVACKSNQSNEKKLEEYYSNENVKKQMNEEIDKVKNRYDDMYQDIKFDVKGDTLCYTYTIADSASKEQFNSNTIDSNLKTYINSSITAIENESGADAVKIRFIYQTSDGDVVFDKTYE